jgi:prepilin-type processing-associated H-X9-DG protein
MAILLYLNDNNSRTFDNRGSNGHLWYDANGNLITPTNTAWWGDAYWGLGYREYTTDEKVFSCPSFVLKSIVELLYSGNANYRTTKTNLERASSYGLNSYFFCDPDAPSTDVNRYHRKTSVLKSPSRFIIMHDHMEPKMEGDSTGTEQNDMFYIPAGSLFNLTQYRTGNRQDYYRYIFRHCKKNSSRDDPSQFATRIPAINNSPNGNANVLFLDGTVDKIVETTGENIPYRMYKGVGN